MKLITIAEIDDGVKIPDDYYDPVFEFHPILGRVLAYFRGRETGVCLNRNCADVLEGLK